MQKTTLADALLGGANATGNLIPQFGNTKAADQIKSEFSFTQAMNDTAWMQSERPSNDVNKELEMKKTVEVTKPNREVKSKETNQPKNNEPIKGEQKRNVAKKVAEEASKVADKVKDEFGVSDEQLNEAMEVVAMGIEDLLNVADIQKLIGQLEGVTDSVDFLTNVELYDSLKTVVDFMTDIKNDLLTELNITEEVLNELTGDSTLFAEILSETEEVSNVSAKAEGIDVASEENKNTVAVEVNRDSIVYEEDKTKDTKNDVKNTEGNVSENTSKDAVLGNSDSKTETFKNVAKSGEKNNNSNLSENANQVHGFEQIEITNADGTQTVETVETYVSRANTENIMRQVTEYIKVNVSENTQSVEMMLHPASLGTVNMQLSAQNGVITAHLTVQDELVKAVLESQLVELEKTFIEQGTKVEAIEVSVGEFNLDASTNNGMADNSQSNREGSSSQSRRRNLNLNEITSFDELDEEDRIEAEMMEVSGSSVNYQA